jgi:hypothetical protein
MSSLLATVFVVAILFIIGIFGWLTQRPMEKSQLKVTGMPAVHWFFLACLLWLIAMGQGIPVPTLSFLILGGPVAFTCGFIFPAIKVVWKNH